MPVHYHSQIWNAADPALAPGFPEGMLLVSALGAGPLSIDARVAAGASRPFKPALAQNA